jgi:SAM-dependent methyltransferase
MNIQEELRVSPSLSEVYLKIFGIPLAKYFRFINTQKILKPINLNNKKILDAGCGIGDFSLYLAGKGAITIGIDMDEKKIFFANQVAKEYQLNAMFLSRELVNEVSDTEESYDGILCLAVLEHIENDVDLLMDFQRILKPNGFLLLDVPSKYRRTFSEKELDAGHARPGYDEKLLKEILNDMGFTLKAVLYYDPYDLIFYINRISSIMPTQRSKKVLFSILFPFFKIGISTTSVLKKEYGNQYTLLFVKRG